MQIVHGHLRGVKLSSSPPGVDFANVNASLDAVMS